MTKNTNTHNVCNERLAREGGKATCCECDPHEGCTLGMKPYPGKFIPVDRLPEATKKCTLCKKELPIDNFSLKKNSKSSYSVNCDKCRKSPMRIWDSLNTEKSKERRKRYIKSGNARAGRLTRRYGVSIKEYSEILASQNNVCAICSSLEPKGRYSSFNIDHDHKTGKVRGLLCSNCNMGIGSFREDVEVIKKVISYLSNGSLASKTIDTHTEEIKQMERAIDEGFAESEKDLKDKKTPLDTHTDWEKRIIENKQIIKGMEDAIDKMKIPKWDERLQKAYNNGYEKGLSDARREVIEKVEKMINTKYPPNVFTEYTADPKVMTMSRGVAESTHIRRLCPSELVHIEFLEDVLATLRKEEKTDLSIAIEEEGL